MKEGMAINWHKGSKLRKIVSSLFKVLWVKSVFLWEDPLRTGKCRVLFTWQMHSVNIASYLNDRTGRCSFIWGNAQRCIWGDKTNRFHVKRRNSDIETSEEECGLSVILHKSVKPSKQCAEGATFTMIKGTIGSIEKYTVPRLFKSLILVQLEYCI